MICPFTLFAKWRDNERMTLSARSVLGLFLACLFSSTFLTGPVYAEELKSYIVVYKEPRVQPFQAASSSVVAKTRATFGASKSVTPLTSRMAQVRLRPSELSQIPLSSLTDGTDEEIEFIEEDKPVYANFIPNDEFIGRQAHYSLSTGMNAEEAWDITTGSPDVAVAVLDTGIDLNHEDLRSNVWVNPGEIANNGTDDDGNGFIDDVHGFDFVDNDSSPRDLQGHGTHVAGTIGATGNNGIGVAGIAWNVRLIAVRVLDGEGVGSTSSILRGINYVASLRQRGINVKIVNLSLGSRDYSRAMEVAFEDLKGLDLTFVTAAGNFGTDNDLYPHYPSSFPQENIVAVSAIGEDGMLAPFSSYGKRTVDVAAPGVSIGSTLPDNFYGALSGTSMATPHVSGTLALLHSFNPSLTATAARILMLGAAVPSPLLTPYVASGAKLDAGRALRLLISRPRFNLGGVVRSEGVGVAGAIVALALDNGDVREFTTGPDGNFVFVDLPMGTAYSVSATKPGLLRKQLSGAIASNTVVELSLDPEIILLNIRGRVAFGRLRTVTKAGTVTFTHVATKQRFRAKIDKRGSFSIGIIPEGRYKVSLKIRGLKIPTLVANLLSPTDFITIKLAPKRSKSVRATVAGSGT